MQKEAGKHSCLESEETPQINPKEINPLWAKLLTDGSVKMASGSLGFNETFSFYCCSYQGRVCLC